MLGGELAYRVEELVVVDVVLHALVKHFAGNNAALAALRCQVKLFAYLTKIAFAIGNGFADLAIGNGFAKADVHGDVALK